MECLHARLEVHQIDEGQMHSQSQTECHWNPSGKVVRRRKPQIDVNDSRDNHADGVHLHSIEVGRQA